MRNSYKDKILISTPSSNTDVFSKSVVLILEHNEEGAFGLVLNKQMKNVYTNLDDILGEKVKIHDGGPVGKDRLFFIIKGQPIDKHYFRINDEYYLTENFPSLARAVLEGEISLRNVKILCGYAGWSPQQLETEITNKHWIIPKNQPISYIDKDENIWKKIIENIGGKYLLWKNTPDNIAMN